MQTTLLTNTLEWLWEFMVPSLAAQLREGWTLDDVEDDHQVTTMRK